MKLIFASLIIILVCCILTLPVSGTNLSTTPSFDLSDRYFGIYAAELGGGYPLFNHPYALFTDQEYFMTREQKNQTIRIISYNNPPLFPNETVYGWYHEELGYVSWLKEYINPDTGVTRLCQVADTGEMGETPYIKNLSPAENDYLGTIGWYEVHGKIWPRTWINGTMYEGQSWTEWWGPMPADDEGSVFKRREAIVSKGVIPVAGNQTDVYIVTIKGPSEFYPGLNGTETFYFADGIGPVGRDLVEITGSPIEIDTIGGLPGEAPKTLPIGEKVFTHTARCTHLSRTDI